MGIIRNQSIKNSIGYYIGMGVGAISIILIYPNVFKEQPEHWGLLSILVAYATAISAFSTLGVQKTFMRFFPSIKEKGQLFFLSLITPLFGCLIVSLFYYFFKEELFVLLNADPLLQKNFFYILLLVFVISFYDVFSAISRSYLDASTPVFIDEIFLKLYHLIVLVMHGIQWIDFTLFLQLYFCGYFVKLAILFLIQVFNNRLSLSFSFNKLDLKEMVSFGIYVLLSGTSVIIATRLDMIMIGALLDLKHVAFYTIAFYIGSAIKVPTKSIIYIAVPLLAKAWEEQDFKQIKTIYSKSSINPLIVGGLFFLCVWINIDAIFSILPEKFSDGKWVVFYIGLAQLFSVASGVNGAIIVNSKYYRYDLITNIILFCMTLYANWIFIPESSPLSVYGVVGINGAAFATALSMFLFTLIRLVLIKIKMNLQPFSVKTVYSIGALLSIYIIISLLPQSNFALVDIFWRSLLASVIFIFIVLKFSLSEDIVKIVNDIISRIKDDFIFSSNHH